MLKKSLYIMLIAVSFCAIILGATQQATQADPPNQPPLLPTLSSSASAGAWGSEASTSPGLDNYYFYNSGGWEGTGSAYANVYGLFTFGDGTERNENQTIRAYIYKASISGPLDPVNDLGTLGVTESAVQSEGVSASKMGAPDADKWASSDGCFGGESSSAYCSYDSSWW